jgi:hypothetical protein
MWHAPLVLALLLLGCTVESLFTPDHDAQELMAKAPEIGALVRAAQFCAIPLSQPAQDRAARIEAAAIELHRQRGGTTARDAYLRGMAPPAFEGRQRGSDRTAWCTTKRQAVTGLDAMLNSAEGTALVERAEAILHHVQRP